MKEKIEYIKAGRLRLPYMVFVAIFCLLSSVAYAQKKTVTGAVKDTKGAPIAGATILEKGANNVTTTNNEGRFSISVSPGAILIVRFIGFTEAQVTVGSSSTVSVQLKDMYEELKEVVVVGYGTQKKESVVAAISQISNKDLLKSSSPNLTQAITGRLAGVITSQPSGAPGADDAQIFIRGRASFAGNNQPLILVDGVERAFSQISPSDVQSISVLKDASATAVYGVRGANGVVLITTKRGREGKPVIDLTVNYQTQSPTRGDTFLDSYNSVVLLEEALKNDGLASQFSSADIEMFKKSVNGQLSVAESQLYPNVNWYNEVLNTSAPSARYNANITGGTSRMKYFTSLDYYDQSGLYKDVSAYEYDKSSNSKFKRYGFRANLDFALTKRLNLGVNFATRFEERSGPNVGTENTTSGDPFNEVFYQVNHTPGWLFPVKYDNGFYGGNSQNQNNIVARLAEAGFYQRTNNINETNFILKHDLDFLSKGLSIRGLGSFDYETYYNRRFNAGFATYQLTDRSNPGLESSYTRFNEDTELTYGGNTQNTVMKLYMEAALDYNRTFGDKHNLTGLVLYSQNDYRVQADLARRYQGMVGRATYNYDLKYFAEVNAGFNGSENFAKGKRFGFFPSFSAGWMLNKESFMSATSKWLDVLKLRASYGEVGNDKFNAARFLYVPTWRQIGNVYSFGNNQGLMGIYEGDFPNTTATWERAKKSNIGLESTWFKGLFSLNFDVFKENRNNILANYLSLANWLGQPMAPGNLGKTINRGYELTLNHNHKFGQFNYFVNANYTHARNQIVDMDEPSGKPDYRRMEGRSIGQFFGLISDGFITSADLAGGKLPVSTYGTVKVGDLKYRDLNSDGFIDERDQTAIGFNAVPENAFSLSLGADWKGISLSAMLQGVSKVSRYYDAEAMFAFVNGGKVKEHHLDRWNPALSEAQNLSSAKYPLLHYDQNGNHNQRPNSFFVKDASFLRLRNVELGYSIPKDWIKSLMMTDLRVYANANNLITWDKLDGITDPENAGSNNYPIVKTINFGLSARF